MSDLRQEFHDTLECYHAQWRNAALDEAAGICDLICNEAFFTKVPQPGAMSAAFKIRALKSDPKAKPAVRPSGDTNPPGACL